MEYKQYIREVVDLVSSGSFIKATKYMAPDFVVRATRKLYGKKIDRRDKTISIILTIGRPNYAEREFIKLCKKSNEPFPVKKVQLKLIRK